MHIWISKCETKFVLIKTYATCASCRYIRASGVSSGSLGWKRPSQDLVKYWQHHTTPATWVKKWVGEKIVLCSSECLCFCKSLLYCIKYLLYYSNTILWYILWIISCLLSLSNYHDYHCYHCYQFCHHSHFYHYHDRDYYHYYFCIE